MSLLSGRGRSGGTAADATLDNDRAVDWEGGRRVTGMTATDDALAALVRISYLLDRILAPSSKVRAYGNAAEVVAGLAPGELEQRVADGTLQDLPGIGPSTGSVITAAVRGEVPAKLTELEETSV